MRPALAVLALALTLALPAWADEAEDARRAQVEELRARMASQLQLRAYELLDELVFQWTRTPPFAAETPVVLADVSVPYGLGNGLRAEVESHFAGLLTRSKGTRVALVHCPACTAWVVHSGARGTVVSRGFDNPRALEQAGVASGSRHALFLDFEAEGDALVLRARLTALSPDLPIVWARTLSSSTAAPALVRGGEQLVSAEQARTEYLQALRDGFFRVPLRVGARWYAENPDRNFAPTPLVWLQAGAELSPDNTRAWLASATLGLSWAPESHVGFLAHARFSRLLGLASSLTVPDVYVFAGGSVIYLSGNTANAFRSVDAPPVSANQTPNVTMGAITLGAEVRLRQRISATFFVESLPILDNAVGVGNYLDLGLLRFHSMGVEVTFCF